SNYLSVLGPGSDETANAIAGDATSALVAVLTSAPADSLHSAFASDAPVFSTWVVRCDLAFGDSPVHRPGIMNPQTSDFHGQLLPVPAYDFDGCAACHGADFSGGKAKASCTECHSAGPTDCSTCHEKTLRSGAHAAHPDCSQCHRVPARYDDPGHILITR